MYLEDIPQLSIGLSILACRGEEESVLVVIKAGFLFAVSILVAALRIKSVKSIPEHLLDKKKNCVVVVYIGHSIVMGVSFVMFYGASKNIEIIREAEHHIDQNQRFFTNVGIYCDTSDLSFPFDDSDNEKWMKLFDIDDIINHGEITTEVTTNGNLTRIQNFYVGMNRNASATCYRLQESNEIYFTDAVNCSILSGTKFHYHFKYLQPNNRLPFGDIQYNAQKTSIGSCDKIAFVKTVSHLRYFRANDTDTKTGHLYSAFVENVNVCKLYGTKNLVDIQSKVWRTGVELDRFTVIKPHGCENTGSSSPHINRDITVPCLIQ